ncbi:unnamed protein product [Rotaria sp. Silwood2]|nr:unnamed protein product [Rotaria sp. Silwood2]CAF4304145.1 unnamed protein product [Rotaria sp. Silwood2]
MLLENDADKAEKIDECIAFYTKFVQSKYKQFDPSDDTDDEEESETFSVITSKPVTHPHVSLLLTEDLISSYYNLYQQFQTSIPSDEKLTQQEQLQSLLNIEWKKIDISELKHDYDQLKREHQSSFEDNIYDGALVSCLRLELNHNYILLSNNEQDLRARDVLAFL